MKNILLFMFKIKGVTVRILEVSQTSSGRSTRFRGRTGGEGDRG